MKRSFVLPNHFVYAIKSALENMAKNGSPVMVEKFEINTDINAFNQLEFVIEATDSQLLQLGIKIGAELSKED